ncbi:MAG: hypothetical protein ACC656_02140, partial [Candidatus Heimdallarchaeota archaeon]
PEQNNQTKYNGNMSFWTGTSITNTANYNNENVISIFNQGASRVFRVDGIENSTNYTSTYHVSNLGIWSNNTYPLDGWIYEFMIFDYEMTLTEIQQVENSLTAKWNPTVTSLVQRNIIPSVSSYNRYPERESDPDQPVLDQNYVEQDF